MPGSIVISTPIYHAVDRVRFPAGKQEIIFSAIVNYSFQQKRISHPRNCNTL